MSSVEKWRDVENHTTRGAMDLVKLQDDLVTLMLRSDLLTEKQYAKIHNIIMKGCRDATMELCFIDSDSVRRINEIHIISGKILKTTETQRKIVLIQSLIRSHLAKKRYKTLREYLTGH